MSDQELDILSQYVRYLANRMNMRDWQFNVGYERSQASPATIEVFPQRCEALIVVGECFMADPPEVQRYNLVHELCHCLLQSMRDCIQTLEPVLAAAGWPFIRATHDNGVESAAHRFAAIISPCLPAFDQWYESELAGRKLHQEQKRARKRTA